MTCRQIGPGNYPAAVVRNLCRLLIGSGEFTRTTEPQRQAMWDALERTREPDQSLSRWEKRAKGILVQRGIGRYGRNV